MLRSLRTLRNVHQFQNYKLFHTSAYCLKKLAADMFKPERYEHVFVDKDFDQRPEKNKPFVKDFFIGRYNERMLVFPEVCDKEELADLEAMCEQIEKFIDNVDSDKIDREAKIPTEILDQMRELGLFGLQIPEQYGGLEMNATKYARVAEITGRDGSLSVTLAAHQAIGLKGILIAGTEEQKEKYLPSLATGEKLAAFCLTEPSSGSDAASITTTATLTVDGKHYRLNGSKIWITNGGIADIFTVFAKTRVVDENTGVYSSKISAFIVERSFGGILSGKPEDKLGIRGSNTCEVSFDTLVPIENVLGELGDGFKVAMNILNSGRFSMGTSCAGALKKLIQKTLDHALTREQFGKPIIEFETIRQKFSRMQTAVYAMEAMAYQTAGIIDSFQKPDASVEAAIVKIFSSEQTWLIVSDCLQILGGLGYMKDYPYERYLRDARILPIFEGTNEILRLYVALTGLQYAADYYKDVIAKLSKPINNFWYVWEFRLERNRARKRSDWKLEEHAHPLLADYSSQLEQYVKGFRFCIEDLLSLHKQDLQERQMELNRMSDICIDLYAMNSVLARASRSLSIGLQRNEQEADVARIFCFDAATRIEENLAQLGSKKIKRGIKAVGYNVDELHRSTAKEMVKYNGCFTTSPLTRNW